MIKKIEGLKCKCERCDKVWDSHRKVEDIMVCPECKSPYWNKPRMVGGRKDGSG